VLKKLEQKIGTREWSTGDIDKYVGQHLETWFSYAADRQIREGAASGGSVTALLCHLLESAQVDGVLAVRTVVQDDQVHPRFFIATSREELLAARGSKYSAVYFVRHGLPLLRSFEGRLAAVLLPCDARSLQAARRKDPGLDEKIRCVISLVCGHNSEPELTRLVVDRIRGNRGRLVDYVYREGHWRGQLKATFENGETVERPFSTFSDYQNLYCFAQRKCHHCHDHFGYFSDISAGDIWSPRMKQEPIKHTALIVRNPRGRQIVHDAIAAGTLMARKEPVEEVCDGQARTLPFHYNTTCRARIGRLFGLKIKDRVNERVRWNDYLVALIAIFNQQITSTRLGRKLVRLVPRSLLRAYLYVFKGLESL
jgi:coenzyme F420-reducing hydrogenase beta subunit